MVRPAPDGQQLVRLGLVRYLLHRDREIGFFRFRRRLFRLQAKFLNELRKFQPQKQGIRRRVRLLHQIVLGLEVQRRVGDDSR